jgi:hypothetical protein
LSSALRSRGNRLAAYWAYFHPIALVSTGVVQKLDPVQIESAMADSSGNSHPFLGLGRKKFNLDFRAQVQICNRKQAHAAVAEIDTQSVNPARPSEYLHRRVQPMAH